MTNLPTDLLRCPLLEKWRTSEWSYAHLGPKWMDMPTENICADELASWLQTVEPKLRALLEACEIAEINIDGLEHNEEVDLVLNVLRAAKQAFLEGMGKR